MTTGIYRKPTVDTIYEHFNSSYYNSTKANLRENFFLRAYNSCSQNDDLIKEVNFIILNGIKRDTKGLH